MSPPHLPSPHFLASVAAVLVSATGASTFVSPAATASAPVDDSPHPTKRSDAATIDKTVSFFMLNVLLFKNIHKYTTLFLDLPLIYFPIALSKG